MNLIAPHVYNGSRRRPGLAHMNNNRNYFTLYIKRLIVPVGVGRLGRLTPAFISSKPQRYFQTYDRITKTNAIQIILHLTQIFNSNTIQSSLQKSLDTSDYVWLRNSNGIVYGFKLKPQNK